MSHNLCPALHVLLCDKYGEDHYLFLVVAWKVMKFSKNHSMFWKKKFYLKRDVKTQKWKSKRPLWFKHRFRREWVYTILVYHAELRWNITNIVYRFYSLTIINNCKRFRKSTRFGPVYGSSFHFNEPIIRLNENLL